VDNLLIVGENRSPTARRMGVRWEDEALAAKPLFEGLRAADVDPADCLFTNWYEDGKWLVRRHKGPILALGKRVQAALTAEGIEHTPLVHPAARGTIRLRSNYVAHVVAALAALRRRLGR
jgi:uracil-DNA glycosylase